MEWLVVDEKSGRGIVATTHVALASLPDLSVGQEFLHPLFFVGEELIYFSLHFSP